MFLSSAFAQEVAGSAEMANSPVANLLPLFLIVIIFYFLLIRPQQKRFKEHRAMIASIGRGDKIITGGGVYGTVTKVEGDDALSVEIAPEVTVKIARDTVASVINRTEPANDR